jgi:hypothetical protein
LHIAQSHFSQLIPEKWGIPFEALKSDYEDMLSRQQLIPEKWGIPFEG